MPRIIKKKEVTRVQVEEVCEGAICDFCGIKTNDYGTGPGVVDWGNRLGEASTVCWATWEGDEVEDMKEIIICPECFMRLEGLIPKIKELMGF